MSRYYSDIAGSLPRLYSFRSPEYLRWLLDRICLHLDLSPGDRLADLGGGTGTVTARLCAQVGLQTPPLCVDESAAMLEVAAEQESIACCRADAHTFSQSEAAHWDKLLMLEVIHHLADRQALFSKLHRLLPSPARVLVITRPRDAQYPLFEAAQQVWLRDTPDHEEHANKMRKAGFTVECVMEEFPVTLPREQWFDMIRGRFWSTLQDFGHEELEAGIEELTDRLPESNFVSYTDKLAFIVAHRP